MAKSQYDDLVIMSIKTYEQEIARADLYRKLSEAEEQIENGESLLDVENVFEKMRNKYGK
jgi:glycine cleavage system H lipoate-binding protein